MIHGFICGAIHESEIEWEAESKSKARPWSKAQRSERRCGNGEWGDRMKMSAERGLSRDSNPGPRAPEARIIPLDH